jgi:thiol-disulfide isomerase/thioredoxin
MHLEGRHMGKISRKLIIIAMLLFLFQIFVQPSLADDYVVVEYFYNSKCGTCRPYTNLIIEIEHNYSEEPVVFIWYDVRHKDNYSVFWDYDIGSYPSAVVNYETKIPKFNLTFDYTSEIIDSYLEGIKPNETVDVNQSFIDLPFFGRINVSGFSLPVLTIVLGGLDSFNPCSIFILFILLSLLLQAQSRRRMLLVGGIFIFFSGFIYFIFMSLLLNIFILTENIQVVTIIAGIIALILGGINIKDFFFYKTGPSLSIPEDKKPGIYKRMRNLVKAQYLTAVIGGTIVLAITVNTFELFCTLGFPFIFTKALTVHGLSGLEYYTYLFFYNVVYVIPLIIIVTIFAFTVGSHKLSEWSGRVLKLLPGIMMVSFGFIFLVDVELIQNILVLILLLIGSVVSTFVISFIWKRVVKRTEKK